MRLPIVCAFLLILLLLISGCSSETRSLSPTPLPTTPIPISAPAVAVTVTDTPTGIPVPPTDPIVGSWLCYSYTGGDRLEEIYTFLANNTWIRLDRNLTDRTKRSSQGTWKNGGNDQYLMQYTVSRSSGTFQYDKIKDEFFDTFYQCTFRRTADPGNSPSPAPFINLTLNSEYKISRIGNFRPHSENLWLIVNVTVQNIDELEQYSLDDRGIQIRSDDRWGSYSINGKHGMPLENPLLYGVIAPGETRQGNVMFSVPEDSHSYTMRLADTNGDDASNKINFENRSVT